MNQMLVSVHFTDEKTEEKKILHFLTIARASLVVQMEKNLPAIQEPSVSSLGQEDSLEKGMATHSSILPWEIPWTEEPGGLQSMGSQSLP